MLVWMYCIPLSSSSFISHVALFLPEYKQPDIYPVPLSVIHLADPAISTQGYHACRTQRKAEHSRVVLREKTRCRLYEVDFLFL